MQAIVKITDADVRTGYEEAHEPTYTDCKIRTDTSLVEVIRAMLTEVAQEGNLSEQQLRQSTGFIIGILSLD